MLDNLMNLVRSHAGTLMQNAPIPAERKEEAEQTAATSIAEGLQSVLSSGGVKNVLQFFQSPSQDLSANPLTSEVSSRFTQNFSQNFGLNNAQASGLASSFLPSVLRDLVSRTNDPNDKSFDLQDIFNQFSGGKTSGMNIGSIFNRFKAGLDKDGDGDVDLDDLKGLFSGSGGLMDKIKGALK